MTEADPRRDKMLKCNVCWEELNRNDPAFITSCGHIFCKVHASEQFSKEKLCPICFRDVSKRGAIRKVDYNDGVPKVIGHYPPDVCKALENAIKFWDYQREEEMKEFYSKRIDDMKKAVQERESQYQAAIKSREAKYESLKQQYDALVAEGEQQIKIIQELQYKLSESSKKEEKMQQMYTALQDELQRGGGRSNGGGGVPQIAYLSTSVENRSGYDLDPRSNPYGQQRQLLLPAPGGIRQDLGRGSAGTGVGGAAVLIGGTSTGLTQGQYASVDRAGGSTAVYPAGTQHGQPPLSRQGAGSVNFSSLEPIRGSQQRNVGSSTGTFGGGQQLQTTGIISYPSPGGVALLPKPSNFSSKGYANQTASSSSNFMSNRFVGSHHHALVGAAATSTSASLIPTPTNLVPTRLSQESVVLHRSGGGGGGGGIDSASYTSASRHFGERGSDTIASGGGVDTRKRNVSSMSSQSPAFSYQSAPATKRRAF